MPLKDVIESHETPRLFLEQSDKMNRLVLIVKRTIRNDGAEKKEKRRYGKKRTAEHEKKKGLGEGSYLLVFKPRLCIPVVVELTKDRSELFLRWGGEARNDADEDYRWKF